VAAEDHIQRLLEGRQDAWSAFVRETASIVYAAIRKQLVPAGRADDAEDVAQDVYVKLCAKDFRILRNFDPSRARLTTWLTVIASNAAIDHLRRHKRPMTPMDALPEKELSVPSGERAWVRIPKGTLTARQELIVRLLYSQDLTVAEVAEKLEIDPQTVRSTHHKALQRLRARLASEVEDS